MTKKIGFVAYPSSPHDLVSPIRDGIADVNRYGGFSLTGWEENDIAGRPLTAPIFQNIEAADFLIADITRLNFNVTYEIGYAIGRKKRIFLIRNKEFKNQQMLIDRIGIYDTLGYQTYANSKEFSRVVTACRDYAPIPLDYPLDQFAPAYLLETPVKGQVMTRIIARVKKARVQFRSFNPAEDSRLSAIDAIKHVATSHGVLALFLGNEAADADIHNIRGAFIAGLSHGMRKPTLLLQSKDGPVPLDVRDFVKTFAAQREIDDLIHDFSLDVFESVQKVGEVALPSGSLLSRVSMGDPMAENEFTTLGEYYLQTDEFGRAARGEVNLVVGRKGTGKTALFSQVRDQKRKNRKNIVVDLKPEGYQLIKLKESVLDFLSGGAKTHLITAFWEYLLFLEVSKKILEKDKETHLRDPVLYEGYLKLAEIYRATANATEGDFSERLLTLSESLSASYCEKYGGEKDRRLTSDQVTELIHSGDIRNLQEVLTKYLSHKGEVWILFDNLDKGWSPHGLARGDITILRCLIDAARKMQRQMLKANQEFFVIVFIRNDVYQLLMEESADFGKESRASLDWSDPELLRQMLRKRLTRNLDKTLEFGKVWNKVCVTHYLGEETSQYLIDRSLMRPRNLLKVFNACRGFAVNLQHEQIQAEDLEKGVRAYSSDLLIEADQELTDIEPAANKLIYQFVNESTEYTREEVNLLYELHGLDKEKWNRVTEFLMYFGVVGIRHHNEDAVYIYSVGYDMQILRTLLSKFTTATFTINPALWPALGVSPKSTPGTESLFE